MEATDISVRARVESVKQAMKSAHTCTSDTVTLLRQLLGSISVNECFINDSTKTNDVRATSKTATGRSRRSPKAVQPKIAAKVATSQKNNERETHGLPQKEKLVLATEVFNFASKAISEYLKTQSGAVSSREKSATVGATPQKESDSTLQPISPNRASRSPSKSKSAAIYTSPENTNCHITNVVDSARHALSSLRDLRTEQVDGDQQFHPQLEQGGSILIGKILALGLNDIAIMELRKQKRRIIKQIEYERGTSRATKGGQHGEVKETLIDLIRFDKMPNSASLLNIIIPFQNQSLKAIAADQKSTIINNIVDSLVLSNPVSPANIITEAYKKGLLPREKASQQLQTLSQTVLSLSLTNSGQEDRRSPTSKSRVKPAVVLDLQILSLEIRSIWWKIANHQCDLVKELWNPLARYIATFARRVTNPKREDYNAASHSFQRLETTVVSNEYAFIPPRTIKCTATSTVMRALGQIAQSAGCLSEANKHYESCILLFTPDEPLLLAICRCRIALLEIEALGNSKAVLHSRAAATLSDAAKSLAVPLKGNQSDLEELVIESSKLKKTAMSFLNAIGDMSLGEHDNRAGIGTIGLCIINYLNSFVRFLNRYLSQRAQSAEDDSFSHERLRKCKNIILAAVDSVVAVGKVSVVAKRPSWDETQQLLFNSLSLLERLKKHPSDDTGLQEFVSTAYSKLSNLFWSRYLKQKDAAKPTPEIVSLLEWSTKLMQNCSLSDKMLGFAAVKKERLASLYFDSDSVEKSIETYHSAIDIHIDSGALDSLTQASANRPLSQVLKNTSSSAFLLYRALGSYLKIRGRYSGGIDKVILEPAELGLEQKGTLLECQLLIMMETGSFKPEIITSLVSKLLFIFSLEDYPIRRTIVIVQAIKFSLDNPGYLEHDLVESLKSESSEILFSGFSELAEDQQLSSYAEFTLNSLRLTRGFSAGHLSAEDANSIINSWVTTTQQCSDWSSITEKVDDAELWIIQMKTLVDYFEMCGFWKLRLSLLLVLSRVLEMPADKDWSAIVTCISKMGLLYNRLGYSNKAGSTLARAEVVLSKTVILPSVIVAWLLSYVEYFIDIGNFDKAYV